MKVAITGGYGFLGNAATEALMRDGHDVFRAHSDEYDLRNFHEADEFMQDSRPHVVVHIAANVGGIDKNIAAPGTLFHDNVRMGMNVIEQARRNAVQRVVLIGTACSYPEFPTYYPIAEDELWNGRPAEATMSYAVAKLALFEMARAYRMEYGMYFDLLIPTNLYGPGDTFDEKYGHVIPAMMVKFLKAKKTHDTVQLYGTGSATRDFLYIDDAARGIANAVARGSDGLPINLGSGTETPILDVAIALSHIIGGSDPIKFAFGEYGPTGTHRRVLAIDRAREALGWEPRIELIDGLERTFRSFRAP
jgi:nucleoside-diphosphate-sugar epimerase